MLIFIIVIAVALIPLIMLGKLLSYPLGWAIAGSFALCYLVHPLVGFSALFLLSLYARRVARH